MATDCEMDFSEFGGSGIIFNSKNSMYIMLKISDMYAGNNAKNLDAAAFLLVNVQILKEGISADNLIIATVENMALSKKHQHNFKIVLQ